MLAKTRSCALNLLAGREHSKLELEHKLNKRNFVSSDIKEVVQDLADKGLQSDFRFVEAYVNMRSRKGFGPIRIRLELGERGIDKELADKFLNSGDLDWFNLADISRIKKFGEKTPSDLKEKVRQMRYLNYKGFNGDHINNIFKG